MFSMFVAGLCAMAALVAAVAGNAWGAVLNTVLCGLNLYIGLRHK